MDVFEAIKGRRSVRKYRKQEIDKKTLEEIVDAGRWAVTARNICPWKFVVITDRKRLEGLAAIVSGNGPFIKDAAAAIAVIVQDTKYYIEDGSAACQNILLAAYAKGVGTCWVAGDKKDYCPQVMEYVKAPAGYKLMAIISCGYPDEKPMKQKPELKDVIIWDKF